MNKTNWAWREADVDVEGGTSSFVIWKRGDEHLLSMAPGRSDRAAAWNHVFPVQWLLPHRADPEIISTDSTRAGFLSR